MSRKYHLPKTSAREFHVIIDSLVTDGLFSIANKGNNIANYESRLQILVPSDDISFAVQDKSDLSKFLENQFVVPQKYR